MNEQLIFSSSIDLSLKHIFETLDCSDHAVLVDSNTEAKCLNLLGDNYVKNIISIPAGESSKSLQQCAYIWQRMTDIGLDRKALFLNLGGGMITDIGAFCASTFKRGIRFVHIPTTLLAMTDAAIGGKTGINFSNHKNHIGLFQNSEFTLINPVFLESLPERELRSGYAEILKHGIINGGEIWEQANFHESSKDDWEKIIELSANFKVKIVKQDFEESGIRKTLNFGHSIGHLLESFSHQDSQNQKLHGEAIAEGMIVESFIAYQNYLLTEKELATIINRINDIFDAEEISPDCEQYILNNIDQDKKNAFRKFLFALPEKVGKVSIDHEVKFEDIKMAISNYNDYLTS